MTDMDGVDQPNRMGPGLVVGVARERTYVALARAAVRFARHHRKELADRAVWLFSSGPKGTARSAAEDTPPREFHQLVKLVEPRGEHVFAGSQPDVLSQEDEEAIDAWTEEIAAELLAVQ